jgi:hypothetical protein
VPTRSADVFTKSKHELPGGIIGGKHKWCMKGLHAIGGVDGDNRGAFGCVRCNRRVKKRTKR